MTFSMDSNRINQELADRKAQYVVLARRLTSLENQLEEQRLIVGLVQAKKGSVDVLEGQRTEVKSAIARLSEEIGERQTLLDAQQTEAANARQAEQQREQVRSRRAICELFAALLDGAARCMNGLAATPGAISMVHTWMHTWANRSDAARSSASGLMILAQGILSDQNDLLVSAIADLRMAAPDLVTREMEAFLANAQARANERHWQAASDDVKARSKAMFDARRAEQIAAEDSKSYGRHVQAN